MLIGCQEAGPAGSVSVSRPDRVAPAATTRYPRDVPIGPKGQKRPADVIENAVLVMKIATGDVIEEPQAVDPRAVLRGRKGGEKGGKARAAALNPSRRKAIARLAAEARWRNDR